MQTKIDMDFKIETIPHEQQRYPTCGDYEKVLSLMLIRVSKMNNEHYEFLVQLHEMVESYLCHARDIAEEDITAFDKKFEEDRKNLQWGDELEPGDAYNAPYRREHFFATSIERLMAAELGVDWTRYERTVQDL